jgi:protein SCO1/2
VRDLALIFVMLAAAPALAHVGPDPQAGIAFDQHLGAKVRADLAFVDARGERTTLGQAIADKPSILLLGYVRCKDLCSVTLPSATRALEGSGLAPGRDYRAIFASIDPREGATVLEQGVERIPVEDRAAWSFIGGSDASAHALAKAVGFHYRYEPDRDAFAHPEGIVVLSPHGRISRYFFGASFEPSDLRLALAEAGQGRTGRLSDRLLLLCYHFDPSTGRYTVRILDALRVLIGLCAIVAAIFAWRIAWPRDARGPRA